MKKFNYRKSWFFNDSRKISFEIAGWGCNPSLGIRVDGDDLRLIVNISFGIGIWLSFTRFLPKRFYPKYYSDFGYGWLPDEREVAIRFHHGSLWWDFWVSDQWSSYSKNRTWRKGCWRIVDGIKGKHTYTKKEIDRREFVLPFLEGCYNVEIIKYDRTDKWTRWFTQKIICFEARAGYYEGGQWIELGIPVEGKGENSWDCDEDATYSMYFPGHPIHKGVYSCYEAALYFWHSMMMNREKYGSAKWLPEAYKKQGIQIIKKKQSS